MSATDILSLDSYDAYGFDIDHTLAKYNLPELFELVYQALAKYLVEEKAYDVSLLEPFDKDFCTRGLVFDVKKGNLLKLAEDGTVLRASHGTKFLTDDELVETYGEKRHWEKYEHMIEKVNNIEGCRIFENFYDMPGSVLCARIVDMADKRADETSYESYMVDIVSAFNHVFHPKQFALEEGGFFPSLKADTAKYIEKCSDDIRDWLKSLKQGDKKLFVMTSSHVDFALTSLEHVFGPDWKTYFDLYITRAKKPGFFTENRKFLTLENDVEKDAVVELEEGGIYSQGNVDTLMRSLSKITGKESPKILFIGDSLRSDVCPAKKFAKWDTVMVLEEMEAEVHDKPDTENGTTADERINKRKKKKTEYKGPCELEKEYLTSERWGSLFTDTNPNEKDNSNTFRPMNTLWGYIIRKYADIAVPQLHYLAALPLDEKISVFNHDNPKQWGFHPQVPEALQCEPESQRKA